MELIKDNRIINYEIIIKNNKNTYLKMRDSKVIVTTNKYTNKKEIIKYLESNFDNIYNKIIKIKNKTINSNDVETLFKENKIYYNNILYDLKIINSNLNNYCINDDKFIIYTNKEPLKFIYEIYKKIVFEKINDNLYEIEKKFNFKYHPIIKIKKLKSCYGNNHVNKNIINISLYLAKFNLEYIKLILYHEFCHFEVKNHNKEFYSLLRSVYPNHDFMNKNLKKDTRIIN